MGEIPREPDSIIRNTIWRKNDRRLKTALLLMLFLFHISLFFFFITLPVQIVSFFICFFFVLILFPCLHEVFRDSIQEIISGA